MKQASGTTNFVKGLNTQVDARLLEDNALSDCVNFLPEPIGGIQKVKVWHKDLLTLRGSTDDRVFTGSTSFATASSTRETNDPLLPTFDRFSKCHYFYTNNFAPTAGATAPIEIGGATGVSWTTRFTYNSPTGSSTIKAGFLLSNDVLVTDSDPLIASVPVRAKDNGHATLSPVTVTLRQINGTAVSNLASATIAAQTLDANTLTRLDFKFYPTGADTVTINPGEFYLEITQDEDETTHDTYEFVLPPTYSPELYGWAEIPTRVYNELASTTPYTSAHFSNFVTGSSTTIIDTHTFANTPIAGSEVYHGGWIRYQLDMQANVNSGPMPAATEWSRYFVYTNIDTLSYNVTANPAYAGGTTYTKGRIVDYGGTAYVSKANGNLGNQPDISPTWWSTAVPTITSVTFDPISNLPTITLNNTYYIRQTTDDGLYDDGGGAYTVAIQTESNVPVANPIYVDYNHHSLTTLAELFVYQAGGDSATYDVSANRLLKASRYAKRNEAMTGTVRSDETVDVINFTDGSSLFSVFKTTTEAAAQDGDLLWGAAAYNTKTQYGKWRNSVGTLSANRTNYYTPKFIGEIHDFCSYQNMEVFAGVGGLVIFDCSTLLEDGTQGKIYLPWGKIVVPSIGNRLDSEYLENAGEGTIDVHPPTITTVCVHDYNPGRIVGGYGDTVFWSGGTTTATLGDSTQWNSLAIVQFGDGADEIKKIVSFKGRLYVFSKKGDLYLLRGNFPTDPAVSLGGLQADLLERTGVVDRVVVTTLGVMFFTTVDGNIWRMVDTFPERWGADRIGSDLEIENFQWNEDSQTLWIAVGERIIRSYYSGGNVVDVTQAPGSYVWDSRTDSFWFVRSNLDAETRTNKPLVFRHGNESWSVGQHVTSSTITAYCEVDVSGKDYMILHNTDEAIKQPEDSAYHAQNSTAYIVTKEYDFGTVREPWITDLMKQVRKVTALGRILDGTDATVSVIAQDGTETSLGTFSGTSTVAGDANLLYQRLVGAISRTQTYRIKVSITSPYRDRLRNLTAVVNVNGTPRVPA